MPDKICTHMAIWCRAHHTDTEHQQHARTVAGVDPARRLHTPAAAAAAVSNTL